MMNSFISKALYSRQTARHLRCAGVVLFLAFLSGCGYHNPNLVEKSSTSPPINIFVPVWENRTNELGLESLLHNALQNWLMQAHRIELAGDRSAATHILDGTIVSIFFPGISYDAEARAQALKAVLTVRYSLTDTQTGETLFADDQFILDEKYAIGTNLLQTEANKKTALKVLADDLGEHIYFTMLQTITIPIPRPSAESGPE
jgi:hypothetical protein